MGLLSDKKKKQDELIETASGNVDNYLREKSGKINRYVATGNRNMFLIIIGLLTLIPMTIGMYLYHANVLTIKPSKIEHYHHTIVAPHLEEKMKDDLYRDIRKKMEKKHGVNKEAQPEE